MRKLKIIIFLYLSIAINLSSQTIVEVKQDKTNYPALGKEENVFYVKKDSIFKDSSQIKSFEELLLIGKCNNWDEASCGIINLSLYAEKAAKTRGYNAASVNYYRGTSKKDTLSVVFYRLSEEKIRTLQEENRTSYLSLINPKSGSDTDVKVEEQSATLYSGTYWLKEVKKYDIPVKLGKGFLKTNAHLSFKQANRRYFIVNGYQLTGASRGIGIGVNSPTLMEIGQLAGEILMGLLTRLGTEE